MRVMRGIVLVAVIALGVGGTGATAVAAPGGGVDRAEVQRILDGLTGTTAQGAQVRIVDNGREWQARSGTARAGSPAPVPRDGVFRMGSVTKTFVATVVLQLVGEGRVALDAPVSRHLPGVLPDGDRITVRDLLQHTSGLYNYTFDVYTSDEDLIQKRFKHWEPAELVALSTRHPLVFEPGTRWEYSNTNFVVAGMVIRSVTGRSWRDEVTRRVLRPAGLADTDAPGDRAALPEPHAHAYEDLFGTAYEITRINPSVADAAGAMTTTTGDLDRFARKLFSGHLLKPAQRAELTRTTEVSGFYGLGAVVLTLGCGKKILGHNGSIFGWYTDMWVSEDAAKRLTLSVNMARGGTPVTTPLFDAVFC
ncbi:serine hydrolase domain-containing protein [Actinosynnema sp. NPDC023587]|uniref:serine hydrolase domain-containing protein n=1 Tax=Actinosynnema sp. NPDC023587 TaxID=3154695 RepID=UPI0033EA2D90